MLSRVIVKTQQWRVSVDALGMGAIRATNQAGEQVKATAVEKQYFMEVLAALRKASIAIDSQSPVAIAVATDFAKAIHQRFRRSAATGGFAYAVFFSTFSAEQTARNYIEKIQGRPAAADDDELS